MAVAGTIGGRAAFAVERAWRPGPGADSVGAPFKKMSSPSDFAAPDARAPRAPDADLLPVGGSPPGGAPGTLDRWGPPAIVALAFALFWAIHLYGFTAPFSYGHYGFHGGEYATGARGTLRFHTIYPVNVPGYRPLGPQSYYIHHPVLPHQLVVLAFLLLGEHEYSIRLAAMLSPLVSLGFLTAIAWRWIGRWQGAFAALMFVLVPINVWYGSHIDQGFPSIACLLVALWFYLRWLGSGSWRHAAGALAFEAAAGLFEWSPYLAFFVPFVHAVVTAFRRRGRYAVFAALHPLTVVLPLGFHVYLVRRAGLWGDLMAAYQVRTGSPPYGTFVRRMDAYGTTLYGRVLIVSVAIWALMLLVRLVRGRARPRDLVGATFAFALVSYAHIFKDAIVTHAYRQLYGNVVATVAATELFDVVVTLARRARAIGLVPKVGATAAALAGALALLLPTAALARAGLIESRAHGGIPGWTSFNPELDKAVLARRVHDITRPGDVVYFHPTYPYPPPHRKDCAFYYDKDLREQFAVRALMVMTAAELSHAVMVLSPRLLGGEELLTYARLARSHPVVRVGVFAILDLRDDHPRYEVLKLGPPASDRSALRRYTDGPYPWPTLLPDPATATFETAELERLTAPPPPPAAPAPLPARAPTAHSPTKVGPPAHRRKPTRR